MPALSRDKLSCSAKFLLENTPDQAYNNSSNCFSIIVVSLTSICGQTNPLHVQPWKIDPADAPKIDDALGDASWQTAPVIEKLTQIELVDGAALSERTEVKIALRFTESLSRYLLLRRGAGPDYCAPVQPQRLQCTVGPGNERCALCSTRA